MKELWASGSFQASFDAEERARNLAAIGSCSTLKELIEISYEDLQTELTDGK